MSKAAAAAAAAAEEEVSYASVVFRTKNHGVARKEEETVYDEVKVQNQTSTHTPDGRDKQEDDLRHRFQLLACCFGNLCAVLLLVIIGIVVYTSSLRTQYDKAQADRVSLRAENENLTALRRGLESQNQNLSRDRDGLTVLTANLTQACALLELSVANLTAEVRTLARQTAELTTRNQELEAEKRNLTGKLQEVEEGWRGLNISRAQWSVDQYCYEGEKRCQSCQAGWIKFQSHCYASNNPPASRRLTWKDAQEHCRGKISDLVVINGDAEKRKVSDLSWDSGAGVYSSDLSSGYWIGLRVVNGTWTWVDGTTLRFPNQQPVEGQCAISVQIQMWVPVSCDRRMRWICEKKGLEI